MEDSELWDEILAFMEEGSVIPVVGRNVARCFLDGEEKPYESHAARVFAGELNIPKEKLSPNPSLNEVAGSYLAGHGFEQRPRREDLYVAFKRVNSRLEGIEVPKALRQLAEIKAFRLFVTTGFDGMLERSLREVRGNVESHSYSPERATDLPQSWDQGQTVVFYLLGKLSADPNYALTEEDTLEFVHALQSETRRPQRLLDQLKNSHLLLLGCNFENWLARFFMRSYQGDKRLYEAAGTDYIADSGVHSSQRLKEFLGTYGRRWKIIEGQGSVDFIRQLYERWQAQASAAPATVPGLPKQGYVFISYAREDAEIARKIYKALDEAGIDAWLDEEKEKAGDIWQVKIKRAIESSAYVLALLSRSAAEDPKKRHVRKEWDLAIEASQRAHRGLGFVIPVAIDDIRPENDGIPDEFREQPHWHRLQGEPDDELIRTIEEKVRDHHRRLKRQAARG